MTNGAMEALSRHFMVQIANKIKESHVQQGQRSKEERAHASPSAKFQPLPGAKGQYMSLYDPNRMSKTQLGEIIWIPIEGFGRKLHMGAMDVKFTNPEEQKVWKSQPKGSEMLALLEPLRKLNSTNWDETFHALCGNLSSYHRYMWAAVFLRQATECTSPQCLDVVSPHLLNLDSALKQIIRQICPREAGSDLENFTSTSER